MVRLAISLFSQGSINEGLFALFIGTPFVVWFFYNVFRIFIIFLIPEIVAVIVWGISIFLDLMFYFIMWNTVSG